MKYMGESMKIRSANEGDAAAIAAIYEPHVLHGTASFEEVAPEASDIRERMDAVLELGLPYLVAEIDGEIAGFAYCSKFRPRSAYRFTVESSVYVSDKFRQRGVARRLMTEAMEACVARGIHEMIAVIANPRENSASVALHESLGFLTAGTLRGVGNKFGKTLDVLLMQRRLAGSTAN